jgi:hypothetical protein
MVICCVAITICGLWQLDSNTSVAALQGLQIHKLLHTYTDTYIQICIHLPTPDPSPSSLCTAGLTSGSVTSAENGCRSGWLLAGAGLDYLPCCKVVCLYCIDYGLLLLRCFFCSHTVLPKEHSLGVIFFISSPSSCYAVFFSNSLSSCPVCPLVLYVCCVCMDRLMANFTGTCD